MKDHPTPTPEQIEAAEELVRRLNFCEDDELDDIEHFDAEAVAQTFAQREAQARMEAAENLIRVFKSVAFGRKYRQRALEAARKALEDL